MVRPPCCNKSGLKKGPWSPDEDIMLVSYIQEHGPGNWREIPTKTGLQRCSKSCRLRWVNYLRPGIKRGNFSESEKNMIVHLQALLGNKWAAIASYLPERTDNDIKNYWNTHLKKKMKELQGNPQDESTFSHPNSKGQPERTLETNINTSKQALFETLSINKSRTLTSQERASNNYYKKQLAPSAYASRIGHIAMFHQNEMNSPKVLEASSQYRTSHVPFNGLEKGFKPQLNLRSSNSNEFQSNLAYDHNAYTVMSDINNQFQADKNNAIGSQVNDSQAPYNMFDNWSLDDYVAQGNLISNSFPSYLFGDVPQKNDIKFCGNQLIHKFQ